MRAPPKKVATQSTFKRMGTTTKGPQLQMERLKLIEQQLQEFLGGSDAAQGGRASGNQTTPGGMEERIGNIERMMGRLKDKAQIGKGNMVTPTNPGPSKAVGAEELREETQRMDKGRQSEE